ncbi:MAG: sugar phosphate isomerase/epimerase [Treponema sp.]|jgi:sugar phosphate isomerase/epimerase|nr:sugar phosphate isomerase/epimerase [Treponema sp.]
MRLLEQFSIQLWSVRDAMQDDYVGVLEKLAKMGYTGVEFAGYGGLSAAEMKKTLAANGLKPVGSHIGLKRLVENLDEEIEYNKILGTEYLICPHSAIKSRDDALQLVETLKPAIAKISDAGLKFAYHNHAHEFEKCGGEYLLDILFENLSPQAAMELDVFWAAHAGVEPLPYMEKHKSRLKLVHVKQIDSGKRCVDLDKGILDYKDIITKAKALGVEHFVLEQEEYEVSSMVSVKNDIDYIMSLEGV